MNAEISKTISTSLLGFGMQIPELLVQRNFVSGGDHAYFNAHNLQKFVNMNADVSETI